MSNCAVGEVSGRIRQSQSGLYGWPVHHDIYTIGQAPRSFPSVLPSPYRWPSGQNARAASVRIRRRIWPSESQVAVAHDDHQQLARHRHLVPTVRFVRAKLASQRAEAEIFADEADRQIAQGRSEDAGDGAMRGNRSDPCEHGKVRVWRRPAARVGLIADAMSGGLGNDTYFVDNAGDSVSEKTGEGVDTVNVTLTSYTLGDNVENLTFIGGGAFTGTGNGLDNTILGGAGADTLNAGAGNDILVGGGNDGMTGGAGSDSFQFFAGFGADTITDFTIGSDKLDISGLGIKAAAFGTSALVIAGGANALITVGGGTITLTGVAAANVHATDFTFAP